MAEVASETNHDEIEIKRPRTVGECREQRKGINPPPVCGFVGCRYNLLLDVSEHGAITFNVPKVGGNHHPTRATLNTPAEDFERMTDAAIERWADESKPVRSCLWDEVKDERTLAEIASLLCMSRQRADVIADVALEKLTRRVKHRTGDGGTK